MKTNFERNRALSRMFGGVDYDPPATLYVALFTAAPTVAGGGVEIAGGGYSRVAVANDLTNFPAPVAGVTSNAAAIVFPEATALQGTAVAMGFFDSLAGGNLLDFQLLTTARLIQAGDVFSFAIGQLQLTET